MTEENKEVVNQYYTQNFYSNNPISEFSGALLTLTNTRTWKSTSYNNVDWDKAEYDTSGFYNPKQSTRLTIPRGVSKVRLSANIAWATVGTKFDEGYRAMKILKNGKSAPGLPYQRYMGISTSPGNISSTVIPVKEGDYFELEVYYRDNNELYLGSSDYTWFSIEVVDYEKKVIKPDFTLIGHRGASGYAEEHTIASYELALKKGADYIEMDLQPTKDNKLLCMHDSTLDRTTTGTGKISDYTLKEIQTKFTMKSGQLIPSLDDVLNRFEDKANYYIETKRPFNPNMDEELLKQLNEHKLIGIGSTTGQVVIQSFAFESLINIKNQFSDIRLAYLVSKMDKPSITKASENGFFAIAPGVATITKELVSYAHSLGLDVHAWTVNELEDMKKMKSIGVDGMFTNYLDEAQRI